MGVYIDMEMPTVGDEFVDIMIYGNGKVIKTGKSWRCKEDGNCYYESIMPETYHATKIPEQHGRLIDADALHSVLRLRGKEFSDSEYGEGVKCGLADARECIKIAPTIIPASEEVE